MPDYTIGQRTAGEVSNEDVMLGLATGNMLRAAAWEADSNAGTQPTEFFLKNGAGLVWPPNVEDDDRAKRALAQLGYLDATVTDEPEQVPYGTYISAIATFQNQHQDRPSGRIGPGSPTARKLERLTRPFDAASTGFQLAQSWNDATAWGMREAGRTLGGMVGIENEIPQATSDSEPENPPTAALNSEREFGMAWHQPGADLSDRDELVRDWKITPTLPGVDHPHLPGILRDLGRYRTMPEDERENWKVRVERAFGGNREYMALGGNIRNRQDRILSQPLLYPRALSDTELASVLDKSNSTVDIAKMIEIFSGALRPSPISILTSVSTAGTRKFYQNLADSYERELRRRGLVPNDLPTRRTRD